MQRGSNIGKSQWRKEGGGSFRMIDRQGRHRIIKPGQIFHAFPDEIPKSFLNLVKLISSPEENNAVTGLETVVDRSNQLGPYKDLPHAEKPFKIALRGAGWYQVINTETGKPIVSKSMRKEAAEKMLAELLK